MPADAALQKSNATRAGWHFCGAQPFQPVASPFRYAEGQSTAHVHMDEIVLRLEIRGLVQGVGYRWSMVEEARRLGVRGWVRNRRDGTVEAMVIGPRDAVDRIVGWAKRGPRSSVVDKVDVFAGQGAFDSFDTRPSE
jgi:acylphosphatase